MKKNIKEIPNYNYSLIFWDMRSDIKWHDFTFDGIGIFDDIGERIKEEPFADFFFRIKFPDKSIHWFVHQSIHSLLNYL